jgi:RNA polymerase sigma factor (sigma-70 family)
MKRLRNGVSPYVERLQSADDLVSHFVPFAKNVAGKMVQKYPMEFDDAAGAAYLGLVEAAQRFDMKKHTSGTVEQHFKAFAYFRIHGAIVDEYRRSQFVGRSAYAKGVRATIVSFDKEIEAEDNSFESQLGGLELDLDERVAVNDALDLLDEREYRIVMGQATGLTGKELSKEFGVDESRISQISIAARRKLEEAIG